MRTLGERCPSVVATAVVKFASKAGIRSYAFYVPAAFVA